MTSHKHPRPPAFLRVLGDRVWLSLLIRSIRHHRILGVDFPRFPPEILQATFVGSSNETALREAAAFYAYLKGTARRLGNPVTPSSNVLDFGCGWGRYLRFFWKDVREDGIFGCDIDDKVLKVCEELGVPGALKRIEPMGALPYPDASFDILMAYSVFTHLPETTHLHWVYELARVARPGAVFVLTLEPRRFIDFIADIPSDTPQQWYRKLTKHQSNLPAHYEAFDAGRIAFMPTNEGVEETYGDAAVPISFVEREWNPYFEVIDYVDDPSRFWQAALVVRRR